MANERSSMNDRSRSNGVVSVIQLVAEGTLSRSSHSPQLAEDCDFTTLLRDPRVAEGVLEANKQRQRHK
jgi:hypothetical protein